MKRITLIAVLMSLILPCVAFAVDEPEVKSAKEAAMRHNDAVKAAEVRMQKEIKAAQRKHLSSVVSAKERLIDDLKRSLRTAAKNDNAANAQLISKQIERLETQIEALKAEIEALSKPADAKLAGLDARLVGYLAVPNRELSQFVRVYFVDDKGQAKVVADISDGKPGVDVGTTYQGHIVNGRFTINCNRWTMRGFDKGRTQQFHVLANGQVEMRHDRTEDFKKNDSMVWHARLEDVVFSSMDEVRKAEVKMRRGTDPPAGPEDNDNVVDLDEFDETEEAAEDEDEGFFGLKIE